jgi:hypothetical protein
MPPQEGTLLPYDRWYPSSNSHLNDPGVASVLTVVWTGAMEGFRQMDGRAA